MKARTFKRHVGDSLKSMKRNGWMTVAAVSAVTVTLILVGSLMAILMNINKLTQDVENDVSINVYVERVATDQQKKALEASLENMKDGNIESLEFITKEQELDDMVATMGENFRTMSGDTNPLSDKYLVNVKDPEKISEVADKIEKLESVEKVVYGEKTVKALFKTLSVVRNIGLAITIGLLLIAIFLISNTIKITIMSRRTEIEIMKLVGATNGFIRWPFLLEGAWIGFLGAVIPIGLLSAAYIFLHGASSTWFVGTRYSLLSPNPFLYQIGGLMLALGVLIGAFGSVISMRRFLKV